MFLTYKFRIKDRGAAKRLRAMSIGVNQVWNYCVATQKEAERRWRGGANAKWPSYFDLTYLVTGCAADLGILSETANATCRQFAVSRKAAKGAPRFRASSGPKRALGWIPFAGRSVHIEGDAVAYKKKRYRFWNSREIGGMIKTGAFVEDARGRWYVTFQCEVEPDQPTGTGSVGIDLGIKALATLSTGEVIPTLRHYRQHEEALGKAQRARNKRRVKAIHAKIANARRHHLHEQSTKLVRENAFIAVGNVNAGGLAKTRMAKSVFDASWSAFRLMLRYKARRHGAAYIEVDERFTSQACSDCGSVSGPKGRKGLRVRHWVCPDCGTSHDRDMNAARNILRVGLKRQPPSEGIAALAA